MGLLPDAAADAQRPVVPEVAPHLPQHHGHGIGGKLHAGRQLEARHRLDKGHAGHLKEVVILRAAPRKAGDHHAHKPLILLKEGREGSLISGLGRLEKLSAAASFLLHHRSLLLMVTVVPRPGLELTRSVSMKVSIMEKPMPLRSSPGAVVKQGCRA